MIEDLIFLLVLITSFLQVLHIFEEINLEAYNIKKGENSKKFYYIMASILILVNYVILYFLYFKNPLAYIASFYTVILSLGNTLAHVIMYRKEETSPSRGHGLPTSIPLGLSGFILLILLLLKIFS